MIDGIWGLAQRFKMANIPAHPTRDAKWSYQKIKQN